jgi:hypothetical protein
VKTALLLAAVTLMACAKKQDPAPAAPAPKAEAPKTQAVLRIDEEKPAAVVSDAGEEKLQLIAVEHPRPAMPEAPAPEPSNEAAWRRRFHDARERIDGFEMRVAKAQEIVGKADYGKTLEGATGLPSHFPPGYEDAKQLLEHADEEREAGKRALEDLEHEAANAGIPLEWRR